MDTYSTIRLPDINIRIDERFAGIDVRDFHSQGQGDSNLAIGDGLANRWIGEVYSSQ
jgi:hypothetical protein